MPERPAINASPLIFLARGGWLDLLKVVAPEIAVPQAVAREIQHRGPADPTAQALARSSWLIPVDPGPVPELIQAWDLGPGESAVLTWAFSHPGTEAIIDDLAGRRCAATLGIPLRGTLGVVLAARKREWIPAARPVVEQLRRSGMYLSERVVDQALALIGE